MPGPGQSLSVTLSRCSLRPSLAAIRAASCDLLALLPGLRIHATVIAHGISTGSLRQCFDILPRALSGSRAALYAPRCPHTPIARTRCPHTMGPLCRALCACSAAASCTASLEGCPHTGSLKSPSAWLPRCPRAVLLMHSSRCARIRLPTPGPSAAALARSVEVQ